MPSVNLIPPLLGIVAVVALLLLARALVRGRTAGDLDSSTLLTLAMAWLVSLPITVVVFTGGLERREDAAKELVPIPPSWYTTALHLSLALLVGLAAVLALRRIADVGRRLPLNPAGLFGIGLWLVAHLASGLQGDTLVTLDGLVLLICLIAATILPRGRGACIGIGTFGVTLAAASSLLAAFDFNLATVPCRHSCLLGAAFTGVMANENLLGTAIVATIPFAYLGFRGRARPWLVGYLALVAISSGSRGSALTAIATVLLLIIVRPSLEATGPHPRRAALAAAVVVGALLSSGYVVLHDWGPANSLTTRPQLWTVAKTYIAEEPAFGYGPYKWETLYTDAGEIPEAALHSTHDQWIEVLFTAGIVGAAFLLAMIVAVLRSAKYALPAALVTTATLLTIGVTERIWAIGVVDFASFTMVGLILLGPVAPKTADQVPAAGRSKRRRHPLALTES